MQKRQNLLTPHCRNNPLKHGCHRREAVSDGTRDSDPVVVAVIDGVEPVHEVVAEEHEIVLSVNLVEPRLAHELWLRLISRLHKAEVRQVAQLELGDLAFHLRAEADGLLLLDKAHLAGYDPVFRLERVLLAIDNVRQVAKLLLRLLALDIRLRLELLHQLLWQGVNGGTRVRRNEAHVGILDKRADV